MARSGLQPRGPYRWTDNGTFMPLLDPLPVPNIVGYFHPVMHTFWETYSLGGTCLLISESIRVAKAMHAFYPKTEFTSCDLFSELMGNGAEDRPHIVWDVCHPAPPELQHACFDSIICQALLEHVIAPTTAIASMVGLLHSKGTLYLQTHTPSFPKHQVPRDYVRFHHDYFEDLPTYLQARYSQIIKLKALYSAEGIVCAAYRKLRGDAS